MIAAWMLYAIVVGGLLGAAALALEGILRTHGLPSRWIWVVSVVVSVAWPLGHWSWENRPRTVSPPLVADPPAATRAELPTAVFPLEPVTVEVAPESVLRLLDGPILAAWAVATGALLLFFLFLFLRTWRLRSAWREGEWETRSSSSPRSGDRPWSDSSGPGSCFPVGASTSTTGPCASSWITSSSTCGPAT